MIGGGGATRSGADATFVIGTMPSDVDLLPGMLGIGGGMLGPFGRELSMGVLGVRGRVGIGGVVGVFGRVVPVVGIEGTTKR